MIDLYQRYFSKRADSRSSGRSAVSKDRDRLIHSSALRRLQGKSQVVGAHTSDFFRTRLTHTLECAQIGKAIATRARVSPWSSDAETHADFCDLVEAACLAHDLGHPPFGHNGEDALAAILDEKNGSRFEGNAQSFRVVTFVEAKEFGTTADGADRWVGLNLTRATIRAICKYPASENEVTEDQKFNVYADPADLEYFDWAWDGAAGRTKTFAAAIMDTADDIAYGVHDFEDGVWAGMIPLHDLVSEREQTVEALTHKVLELDGRRETSERSFPDRQIGDPLRALLDPIRDKYWAQHPFERTRHGRRQLKEFTANLIHDFIHDVTEDGTFTVPEGFTKQRRDLLTGMTWVWMIERTDLATERYGQRRIVRELFNGYWTDPSMIPRQDEWREVQETSAPASDGRWPEKARLIRDHIAGMTNAYALRVHREMYGGEGLPAIGLTY